MPKPHKRTVADLIQALSMHDPAMPVAVFTAEGDYGTPNVHAIMQRGEIKLVAIVAEEDD